MDYYLKFDTEEQARHVLYAKGIPRLDAVDFVGVLHRPTGVMVQDGDLSFPEVEALDGYHVNVRHYCKVPELLPFAGFPKAPMRVFA